MSESDPLQKINWCLRVNEIDPTKGRALQEINLCLKVTEIDLINESTHQKRESKSCLEVNEIDFTKRRTL